VERKEAISKLKRIEGIELHNLAEKNQVTIRTAEGRVNKGWAGHTIERFLGLPLNSVWGTNQGSKWRGVKGMKRFSVHFNVHTPIQIVFLNNFENCRSLFKHENLDQGDFPR
jgi:DNA mismatch repair protein MutH